MHHHPHYICICTHTHTHTHTMMKHIQNTLHAPRYTANTYCVCEKFWENSHVLSSGDGDGGTKQHNTHFDLLLDFTWTNCSLIRSVDVVLPSLPRCRHSLSHLFLSATSEQPMQPNINWISQRNIIDEWHSGLGFVISFLFVLFVSISISLAFLCVGVCVFALAKLQFHSNVSNGCAMCTRSYCYRFMHRWLE